MINLKKKMCYGAANSLFHSLETIQSKRLENNEIDEELLNRISNLNLSDQNTIANLAHYYFNIKLNETALNIQLDKLALLRHDYEVEDGYILQGAPIRLMRRIFGMHPYEFAQRRKALGLKGVWSGRPIAVEEKVEQLVWLIWEKHKELEERERFMAVAEDCNLDLHIVWSALRGNIDR